MSTSNFPTSQDDSSSLPNPTATGNTNNPSHAGLHTTENDAIKALENKLGIGDYVAAADTLLLGTGAGTSEWSGLTSAQLAAIVSDEVGTGKIVFNDTPTLVTPKVDTINESTTDNGVTIDGVNIKDGVITTSGAVTSDTLAESAVTADKLATNAITLGYTAVTHSSGTTTSNSWVQQTAFNTTVTIPSGGRKVKITLQIPFMYNTTSGDIVYMSIWNGSVSSGTLLNYCQVIAAGANNGASQTCIAVHTPSAGSATYSVGLQVNAGTGGWQSNAFTGGTAFLLVEAI